jgi:hypothetical protein
MKRLLAALALLALTACGEQLPVSQADKDLFVRPGDFAAFGIPFGDTEALEKFTKAKSFDGSYELTHTFTAGEGSPRALYLYTSIHIARREADAMAADGAGKIGLLIAFKKDGVEEREVAGVKTGKLTLLVKDGKPLGNVYTVRERAKAYMLVMSGLYIQEAALWQQLMDSKMQRLRDYSAEAKS